MTQKNNAEALAKTRRTKLKISNIKTDPSSFQFRKHGLDPAHVTELAALVKRGVILDPMVVWRNPTDGCYCVLAGHHRHQAYRRNCKTAAVQVEVFSGSFEEAQAYALRSNTKNQLPMTTEERQNGAWRLVCQRTGEHEYPLSIANTSRSAGISTSQVSNMRKVLERLHKMDEHIPETWWEALGRAKDEEDPSDDEARLEAQYARMDAAFGSALTEAGRRCPAALGKLFACRLGSDFHTVMSFASYDADYDPDHDYEDDLPF
jgi:hypothetical protein